MGVGGGPEREREGERRAGLLPASALRPPPPPLGVRGGLSPGSRPRRLGRAPLLPRRGGLTRAGPASRWVGVGAPGLLLPLLLPLPPLLRGPSGRRGWEPACARATPRSPLGVGCKRGTPSRRPGGWGSFPQRASPLGPPERPFFLCPPAVGRGVAGESGRRSLTCFRRGVLAALSRGPWPPEGLSPAHTGLPRPGCAVRGPTVCGLRPPSSVGSPPWLRGRRFLAGCCVFSPLLLRC